MRILTEQDVRGAVGRRVRIRCPARNKSGQKRVRSGRIAGCYKYFFLVRFARTRECFLYTQLTCLDSGGQRELIVETK